MRGGYAKYITAEPGKCGGCKHFERRVIGGKPIGSGTCRKKPGLWMTVQSRPACKKHYEPKEATASETEDRSQSQASADLP